MIVGTAGHIDHGKTSLVQALTGVDTDRLPEEKRRGITIELGYAFIDRPGGEPVGFIDVPGHERLVHTMLMGATGIDHALLVVAADDGVMPQTREHLAIFALLGITQATVAITKCDRADAARIGQVREQVAALLAGTALAGAPVFEVSARSGAGVAALRSHLLALQQARQLVDDHLGFRLAIDRVFSLTGVGTVVTGTVHAGSVAVDAELQVAPTGLPLRVRSVHAQNRATGQALRGQRCALAVAGVERDQLHRGDWLCAPPLALATERLDVWLTLWRDEPRALRSGTPVHLHLGALDMPASVALLDGDSLAPGASALVQLVLHKPIAAWRGDRLVLRDASASRSMAGGRVLDIDAPARYRRTPQRIRYLEQLRRDTPAQRLSAALQASPLGVDLERFRRQEGLVDLTPLAPALAGAQRVGPLAFAGDAWRALGDAACAALADHHAAMPDVSGPDPARLRRLAAPRLDAASWLACIDQLVADGRVLRQGAWLQLPAHQVRLSATDQRIADKLLPRLLDGRFDPPWVRDLAAATGEAEPLLRTSLLRLAQQGQVYQVVRDLYYHPLRVAELAALARQEAARDGEVRAAPFRDACGLGRKRAIQILEFFDRIGLLRRVGDRHLLRTDTKVFADLR